MCVRSCGVDAPMSCCALDNSEHLLKFNTLYMCRLNFIINFCELYNNIMIFFHPTSNTVSVACYIAELFRIHFASTNLHVEVAINRLVLVV